MSLNNSQSDKILGYNIIDNICYIYNNENWTEYKKNINSVSIGCDGTIVFCESDIDSKIINKSIDIYNNQTILSTINLPPNFEPFISLAVGNSNYIWGITSTNIYNYNNNYWNNITNIGLKNGSLSGIYIGFDGSGEHSGITKMIQKTTNIIPLERIKVEESISFYKAYAAYQNKNDIKRKTFSFLCGG